MPGFPKLTRPLLLVLAAGLAAPAAGHAAPGFLSPTTISGPPGLASRNADAAINASGTAIVVSSRNKCNSDPGLCTTGTVDALIREPGQPLGAATPIPGAALTRDTTPQVTLTEAGLATAVWTTGTATMYSTRQPGGTFAPALAISANPGPNTADAALATNAAGDTIAVWMGGSPARVHYARKTSATAFGAAAEIVGESVTAFNQGPTVAIDAAGNAIAMWSSSDGAQTLAHWAFAPAGAGFGPIQSVSSPGIGALNLDLALDAQGNAVAVWSGSMSGNQMARYAVRPAGGTFGAAQTIPGQAAAGNYVNPPSVAIGGDGWATAVWPEDAGPLRYALMPPGGAFGEAQTIAGDSSENPFMGDTAADAAGNVLTLWSSGKDPRRVRWARRTPGSDFGPAAVFGDGIWPAAALEPGGNGIASWQATDPVGPSPIDVPLFAAGFDATPPTFGPLSIPSAGVTGKAVDFSAGASDFWGPVAFQWSFGDGTAGAPGAAVTHAYDRRGTFDAVVTATDAVGSSATRSGLVGVKPSIPTLAALGMTRRRFAVGRARTPIAAQRRRKAPKRGTAFRFQLSEQASVRIQIDRALPGRRARRKCVKPRPRHKGARRCTRYEKAGAALTRRNLAAGARTIAFSGRIGRRALKPGRYRATLVATGAAGGTSAAKRITFRVLRVPRR